jgi:predicted nucleotidyltransferase
MNDIAPLLEEAVARIVQSVHPLRIVLFGSALTGRLDVNSDLDLLVEIPDGLNRLDAAYRIHRSLRGLGVARDVVVVFESEVEQLRDNPYLVIHTALKTGRELYHAA